MLAQCRHMVIRLALCNLNPDLRHYEPKIGVSVTPLLGNVYDNFDFSALFYFQVSSPYVTD